MSLFEIIKDILFGLETCNSMPLHFFLKKSVSLHSMKLQEGRYNYISHDPIENSFIYRNGHCRNISLTLKDFQVLKKMNAVKIEDKTSEKKKNG